MNTFVWLLLGLLLGVAFVVIARRHTQHESSLLANGLVIAAFLYVLFALVGEAGAAWLIVELAGVLIFTAMAWAGLRYSMGWLVLGWATHVIWDVALHLVGNGRTFTAPGYPLVCITFDLVLAIYILFFMNRAATRMMTQ